jgi:hypothetical protein
MIHMCMDIRGAIKNKAFSGFTNDDGSPATREQALEYLMDELAKGHDVIPLGECDNFDFKKGCLGHEDKAVAHES